MKSNAVLSIIIFFTCLFLYADEEPNTILILPFTNSGSIEYDYLCDQISIYFYSMIKGNEEFQVIHPYKLKSLLYKMGYNISYLEDPKFLQEIIDHFKALYLIGGYFTVKGKEISAFIYIKKEKKDAFVVVNSDIIKGELSDLIIQTFDNLFLPTITSIIGENIKSAFFTVKTDDECSLYVDNEFFSKTPIRTKLFTGGHRVQVIHTSGNKDSIIYDNMLQIQANDDVEIDIPVFVNLKITSSRDCVVFIDHIKKGITPLELLLYSGSKYELKLVYINENKEEIIVEQKDIDTTTYENVILDYPDTGVIEIIGEAPFKGCVEQEAFKLLPRTSQTLTPGDYRILAGIEDTDWNTTWVFHDAIHTLEPYNDCIVDLSGLDYKKRIGLCFLPGVSQFHNYQSVKGKYILALFYGSLISAGLSLIRINTLNEQVREMKEAFDLEGVGSGYTQSDINNKIKSLNIVTGIKIGTLIMTGVVYIYSFIDGIVCMNHLDNLVHGE